MRKKLIKQKGTRLIVHCPKCQGKDFENVDGKLGRFTITCVEKGYTRKEQQYLFECINCRWRFNLDIGWNSIKTWE